MAEEQETATGSEQTGTTAATAATADKESTGSTIATQGNETGSTTDGEGKPQETTGAPETYAEFTAPEGVTLDPATLEMATPVLKELGLNQESAQKVVDLHSKVIAGQLERWQQDQAAWEAEVKKDPEIGGDKYTATVQGIGQVMKAFSTPELRQFLDDTGFGNNPHLVRFLHKIASSMSEDTITGATSGAGEKPPSLGERMYAKSHEQMRTKQAANAR